jgi:hypothetical protein
MVLPPPDTTPPISHNMRKQNNASPEEVLEHDVPSRSVTLEFVRGGIGQEIRVVDATDGSLRLIASLLGPVVLGEDANLTAALLMDQIDQLPHSVTVERVKINSLQFTKEAILSIAGFLSMHTHTIKYVSMKDIMTEPYTREDEQAFVDLCQIFAQAATQLETLNLSDNTITAPIWNCWSSQRTLHQLILDYVEMDDDSLASFASNFTFAETLEELYVVLTQNIRPRGLIAANAILKACRNIRSLRWAVKDAPPDAFMPWRGLRDMAHEMNNTGGSYLLHLVMDGGTMSEEDAGPHGLAGAVEHFPHLQTLKLRSIGLTDVGVQHLARAIIIAQPALDVLDLSRNVVQSFGAAALAKLSDLEPLTKHLACLSLERNNIDAEGARILLEAFGMRKTNPKLDIKLDGNPIHFSKFAFQLALRKGQIQQERDQLYQELHGVASSPHHPRTDSATASRPDLQEQVRQLQEEKATLLRAFCLLGNANQMEEQVRWMNRVVALEALVLRQNQMAEKENMDHSAPALMRQTILQPIPCTDLSSPSTCDASTQPTMAHHPMHRIDPPMTPGGGFRNLLRSPMPTSKPKVGTSVGERWVASPGGPKQKWTVGGSILPPAADGPPLQSPSAAGLSGYLKHQLHATTSNSTASRKSPSVGSSYGGHGDDVSRAGSRSANGKSSVDRSSGPRMPTPFN